MKIKSSILGIVTMALMCQYNLLKSQNLVTNSNMESSSGWTVENQGTANPATYTFNYTASKPTDGAGGCLKVTSSVATNILFYQALTLTAGKTYTINAAVKTNTVASFWLELFLSTTAPVAGSDYNPSADLIRGLSTWYGCGPNLDGLMSVVACRGKNTYTVPGTAGNSVTVYCAIKTGSMSTAFPETMNVLIDEVSVTEYNDSKLQSSSEGTLNQTALSIDAVNPTITFNQLREGLRALPTSTISVVWASSGTALTTDEMATVVSSGTNVSVAGTSATNSYAVNVRNISAANSITATTLGTLDESNQRITSVPSNVTVAQLYSALTLSSFATSQIILSGSSADPSSLISSSNTISVTAENGTVKTYSITVGSAMSVTAVSNLVTTVASINNTIYTLSGSSVIHITNAAKPLPGSRLNLTSDNVWIYFDNLKPQTVNDKYLGQILINGNASVPGSNMRLIRYGSGTLVVSQASTYQPLTVYSGTNLSGNSMSFNLYTYYRPSLLGGFNDNISSFVLKKGYMATLAADSMGTGLSRNYVAADADLTITNLEVGLNRQVSFIRVFPWIYSTKKGWAGGSQTSSDVLNCSWTYDWNNEASSSLNIEYVPMRHNRWWNSYSNINNKQGTTASLGFNEPNSSSQANMTVAEAVAEWPNLLQSGLRVGSPCPTDGGASWLYSFIDSCDAHNYRVDFVALHFYRCGQTTSNFYSFLKSIYDRTKRPIWVTEWNNGANWTTCSDPTYASQAETVEKWIHMMDTCSFVERYSIYEWVEDTRKIFFSGNILTPAGEAYQRKISPMAYNSNKIYRPAFIDNVAPSTPVLTSSNISTTSCVLTWTPSTDNGLVSGYAIYKDGILLTTTTSNSYSVSGLTHSTTYTFTVKAYDSYNNYSAESNAVAVTTYSVPTNGVVYRIVAKNSGKSLTIRGASTANSAYLTQNTYDAGTHQQFKVVTNGSYYNLYPQHVSGKVLDVSGSSTANDANVLQYTYGSSKTNQQFTFVNVSGPYYQIKNRNSGKCLYVVGASTDDDVQIKQYTCSTISDNQLFTFTSTLTKSASLNIVNYEVPDSKLISIRSNPFTDKLFVVIENSNISKLQIFNIEGKIIDVIDNDLFESSVVEIGANYKQGIYFIEVLSNDKSQTFKVIKQ